MLVYPQKVKRKVRRTLYCKTATLGKIQYQILPLPVLGGKPLWVGVHTSEPLLLPLSLSAPPDIPIYGGKLWRAFLSAEKLTAYLLHKRCDLIVCDRYAQLCSLLPRLSRAARITAVFTKNVAKYKRAQSLCFEENGVFVSINSYGAAESGVIFCPFGSEDFPLPRWRKFDLNYIIDDDIIIPPAFCGLPLAVSNIAFSEALCRCQRNLSPDCFLKPGFEVKSEL